MQYTAHAAAEQNLLSSIESILPRPPPVLTSLYLIGTHTDTLHKRIHSLSLSTPFRIKLSITDALLKMRVLFLVL